jgi:hypothetical protein
MRLDEKRRGNADPAPDQLNLQRKLWLDFSGRGYTVQDGISGTMSKSWRLEMIAPQRLGRARLAMDQVITRGQSEDGRRRDSTGTTPHGGRQPHRGQNRAAAGGRLGP